jgi:HEAT repeat protein
MRALSVIGVFAIGAVAAPFAASVGTNVEPAAPAVQAVADDTASLARLLTDVRGAPPLHCELAVRAVDGRVWWGNSGSPLEVDSSAAALIRWIHTEHNDPRIVPRLVAALRGPDACGRRIAGSMLGHVDHPSARGALMSAIDDDNAATRNAAVIGLGIAEHQPALRPLIARLRDASPEVRRSSAWALGELEQKEAMLPLIDVLTRDSDARVRQAAAAAIGKVTS